MPNGTVKFFNAAKGFGFISPDEGGKDVFVTAASVTAAGIELLKAGQRLSFETKPDAKGPKAIDLKLLAEAPAPKRTQEAPRAAPRMEEKAGLTFYHDPAYDRSHDALAEIRAAGFEPRVIDYIATPPTRDQLRDLSRLLGDSNQSLVKKHDPLFHDLRLDDRFISQNELWDAIVEHPSLINGPVAAIATRANVCRAENSVRSFLAAAFPDAVLKMPVKEKALAPAKTSAAAEEKNLKKTTAKPAKKAKADVKEAPVKKTKAVAKAKVESASKVKAPAKKAAKKPVRKS
jgi:arsenate reductase (glutaredoxin)